MESQVIITSTPEEMERFFESDDLCLVKHMEYRGNEMWSVLIRHPELRKPLKGKFTIEMFKEKVKNNMKRWK